MLIEAKRDFQYEDNDLKEGEAYEVPESVGQQAIEKDYAIPISDTSINSTSISSTRRFWENVDVEGSDNKRVMCVYETPSPFMLGEYTGEAPLPYSVNVASDTMKEQGCKRILGGKPTLDAEGNVGEWTFYEFSEAEYWALRLVAEDKRAASMFLRGSYPTLLDCCIKAKKVLGEGIPKPAEFHRYAFQQYGNNLPLKEVYSHLERTIYDLMYEGDLSWDSAVTVARLGDEFKTSSHEGDKDRDMYAFYRQLCSEILDDIQRAIFAIEKYVEAI